MSSSLDPALGQWLSDIEEAVSPLLTGTAERLSRIRRLQEDPPQLALAGTYNTGKSSLLKRLCVDDGIPVPEGLVIQGEPSTSTVESARIGPWLVIDTPGLDAPHPEHVQAALRAAREADRVLVFVNPDLFSESSLTASLLRELAPGSAAIAVCRIDKAVMSSADLGTWFSTKRPELVERAGRLGHENLEVFPVAPDARGLVRNSTADPGRYDRSRVWDGVADLRRWMELPPSKSDREHTLARRGRLVLDEALDHLGTRQEEHRNEHAEIEATCELVTTQVERVNAAEADARHSLIAVAQEAARSGPPASARSRITVAADRELERIRRIVRSLAGDVNVDEPPWTGDLGLALQVPTMPDDEDGVAPDLDLDGVEEAIRAEVQKHAGDSARQKELEADLREWQEAKRRGKTREHYADDDTAFDRLGDAGEAERQLGELRRRDFAVRLGEVALDSLREERDLRRQRADQERAAEIARDRAEELAARMTALLHDAPGGVSSVFGTIRVELDSRQSSHHDRSAFLAAGVRELEQAEASLRSLANRR